MQGKNKPEISVVIITLNEEKNIKSCLDSVIWTDEIIVVDSYSKDKTVDIVKNYTEKIYYRKFDGNFSKQRNFAIRHVFSNWILVLDADEKLPKDAHLIIKKLIRNKNIDGYWFPRRNYINKWKYLKHGYFYPDYQLRLFRNGKGIRYSGVIHEQPVIDKYRTVKINDLEIYHNDSHTKYNSFLSIVRFLPFVRIEAEEVKISNKSSINLLISGFIDLPRNWYRSFIKEEGYRDGYNGLRAALLHGLYRSLVMFYSLLTRIH